MADIDRLMIRRARAMAGKSPDDLPEDDEDFGLHYPLWYVFDTWTEHEDHSRYPESGGYSDQSHQLMEDWKVLDRRFAHAQRNSQGGDDLLKRYATQEAKDWSDL